MSWQRLPKKKMLTALFCYKHTLHFVFMNCDVIYSQYVVYLDFLFLSLKKKKDL